MELNVMELNVMELNVMELNVVELEMVTHRPGSEKYYYGERWPLKLYKFVKFCKSSQCYCKSSQCYFKCTGSKPKISRQYY